ncbi:unnamed protein product, partial [Callosobruchus maculatus]
LPIGQGSSRTLKYNSFNEECIKRKGIISIKNNDNLCLPRALVVAKALIDKDPGFKKVRQDVGKLQEQRARLLTEASGVFIPEGGAGISQLQQFQRHLIDYKIIVYAYGSKDRDVIFKGSGVGPSLNLLHHNNLYNVISSLTAAFSCGYFCEECHVPFNSKKVHRCGGTCSGCHSRLVVPVMNRVLAEKNIMLLMRSLEPSKHDKITYHYQYRICEKNPSM